MCIFIGTLIAGENEADHLQTLEKVLKHLVKAGLTVREYKRKFMTSRFSGVSQSCD